MATYSNLNRPTMLREDDTVIFQIDGKEAHFDVQSRFLRDRRPDSRANFAPLKAIGFRAGSEEVKSFLREAYGYDPISGDWPEYRKGDFAAATRAVNAIMDRMFGVLVNPKAKAVMDTPLFALILGVQKTLEDLHKDSLDLTRAPKDPRVVKMEAILADSDLPDHASILRLLTLALDIPAATATPMANDKLPEGSFLTLTEEFRDWEAGEVFLKWTDRRSSLRHGYERGDMATAQVDMALTKGILRPATPVEILTYLGRDYAYVLDNIAEGLGLNDTGIDKARKVCKDSL